METKKSFPERNTRKISPGALYLLALLCFALFQAGGFHTYVSAGLNIILTAGLLVIIFLRGQLRIGKTLFFPALLLMCMMHFAVGFYAVDSSMSIKGGVKFLPVILFYLVLLQLPERSAEDAVRFLPVLGAVQTVLSMIFARLPGFQDRFLVDGRLAGFFEYPNSFAVFLLICLVIAVFRILPDREGKNPSLFPGRSGKGSENEMAGGSDGRYMAALISGVCGLICLAGILLSGSRTVYVLLLFAALFLVLYYLYSVLKMMKSSLKLQEDEEAAANKKEAAASKKETAAGEKAATIGEKDNEIKKTGRRKHFLIGAVVFVAFLILLTASGAARVFLSRLRLITASSSTLAGRLLYAQDALRIISKHPFGLGYYGYRFIQGSFKTGVYNVVNVHNELLQAALDVGILPALFLAAATILRLLPNRGYLHRRAGCRTAAVLLLLHALLDYDFQFMSLAFVFLLLLPANSQKILTYTLSTRQNVPDQKTGKHHNLSAAEAQGKLRLSSLAAAAVIGAGALIIGLSVWIGLSDRAYVYRDFERAEATHPDTLTELNLLTLMQTEEEREYLADRMMKRNAYASQAYAVAAQLCYAKGDIQSMTIYQKAAIRTDPYRYTLYTDYLKMLCRSAKAYHSQGNKKDAHMCAVFAREIPQMLWNLSERTSSLGWRISVSPVVTLDEDNQKRLDEIKDY